MRPIRPLGLSLVVAVLGLFGALRAAEAVEDAIVATELIEAPEGFSVHDDFDVVLLRGFPSRPIGSMDEGMRSLDAPEWFRLRLERPAATRPEPCWLLLQAEHQREIDAVLVVDGKIVARAAAGFRRSEYSRVPLDVDLALSLAHWRTGPAEVIIRADSVERMLFSPRVMPESTMRKESRISLMVQSAYFGGALALTFFQFLLFLYLRERTSLDYALFAVGLLLGALAQWGYYDHLLGGLGGFYLGDLRTELKLVNTWLGLRCLFSYFELTRRLPQLRHVPALINLLIGGALLLGLVLGATQHHALAAALQSVACIGAVLICGWSLAKRLPGAALNAIGWAGLLFGAVWANLIQLGLLSPPRWAYLIPTGAVAWQMVWNSLLVTHRLRRMAEMAHAAELQRVESERTARALAESERAKAALEHAARVKDQFMANMSHELRTPLNGVLGNTAILREQLLGPLNAQQTEMLQSIDESGRRLLSLVDDVLDATRLEAGQLRLARRPVEVAATVARALESAVSVARQKRITLGADVPADLPVLHADPRRLAQMLNHLLSNAVKFTPVGGNVGVVVRAGPGADGPAIRFEVRDTGIGIAPEDQVRLFRPFFQLDSGLSRRFEGSGLGLSLVRGLAQLHGGTVGVHSAVGRGSCFWFELPLGSPDAFRPEDMVR